MVCCHGVSWCVLLLQVWDSDEGLSRNTGVAQVRVACGDVALGKHEGAPRPTPEWLALTDISGQPVAVR